MKSILYSTLLFVVFGLFSCSKDNFQDQEYDRSQLERKEGDDEDQINTGVTIKNSVSQPQVNVEVHTINTLSGIAADVSVTDSQGSFNCMLISNTYFFEVYEDGELIFTSGDFDINQSNNSIEVLIP